MARNANVCKHLHLPVQSGSDRVLEAMGRGYTRDEYLTKVSWMHELIPEATVSSDFIVGFPGETEADFRLTLDLIRTVGFSFIYSFAFSARPDTRAALMEKDATLRVSDTDKRRRLQELQELQSKTTKRHLEGWVGRNAEVLVEGPSRRGGNQLTGRTSTFEIVNFYVESPADSANVEQSLIGSLADVRITAAGSHTLEGALCSARGGADAAIRGIT
jgi:tRNA-2-methylthio-N6-dimethylallyladenosine synthase